VSCAAVRGITMRGTCAQRIVTGTIPTTATTTMGFGWPFSPVASHSPCQNVCNLRITGHYIREIHSPTTIIWDLPFCQSIPMRFASAMLKIVKVAPESTKTQTQWSSVDRKIELTPNRHLKLTPSGL